jgi:hypothetical protein
LRWWRGASLLLVAVVALAAAQLAAADCAGAAESAAAKQGGSKKKRGSKRVVVSPRSGQRVGGHPLRIVVRADHGLRDLSARLNGRRIAAEFGPRRKGVRRALVSASHGMRYGRNVLRVRARQRNGRWRRATVRFRVVHDRPLAGAGFDRRVHVRQGIRLDGRASKARGFGRGAGAARSGRRARLRYRWRLVAAPKRSRASRRLLRGHGSARPFFRPDAAGTYAFKLTVADGSGTSADRLQIQVAPRSWLVPVDTMASQGGGAGISVGGAFHPAGQGSGNGSCLLQVLVLERATLGSPQNRVFGGPGCSADPGAGANPAGRTAAYLKQLNDSKLVIAVSQPGFAAPHGVFGALRGIGLPRGGAFGSPLDNGVRVNPGTGGRISVIGVPGLGPGEAQVRTLYDGDAPDQAALQGYLTPDQFLNFKWLPRERVEFDTRAGAPGDGSPAGPTNTIQVGEERYTASLPAGAHGGFQVLVLDRGTLQARAPQQVFAVSDTQSADAGRQSLKAMHDYIVAHSRLADLVFVASLGAPAAHVESWTVAPALSDLAGLIGWDGGSRHDFIYALRSHLPYSLVGRGAAQQLGGEEIAGGAGGGRLRGALMTDRTSLFIPRDTSPLSDPGSPLVDEVLKPPSTKWPLDGNPQAKAALSYIGTQTKPQLGPDPRSAFVNPIDWDAVIGQVRAMSYPGSGHGFCEGVPAGGECRPFTEVKRELIDEMLDVDNVRTYVANISRPFADNGLSSWASLQSIAGQIQRAAEVKPNETLFTLALDIAGGILEVIPIAIPEAYAVVRVISEVVAITYATAIEYWSQNREGGADDEVSTTAERLGVEIAERFKDAIVDIEHMGNVIVTDPEKLRRVGAIANCNPVDNDRCPQEWAWTDDVKTMASAAISRGTEAGFYQELLPLAFPTYRLAPNPGGILEEHTATIPWPTPPGPYSFYCGDLGRNRPFKDAGTYGAIVLNNGTNIPQSPSHSTQAFEPYTGYAIGAKANVDATHPSPVPAPAAILNRMFAPVDPGSNPRLGGLGIDWPDYMMESSDRTYGPKDPFGSNCGWE